MAFHPFKDMSPSDREEYQAALHYMHQDIEFHNKISTNGATKFPGHQGSMYGIGWRGGTTQGK